MYASEARDAANVAMSLADDLEDDGKLNGSAGNPIKQIDKLIASLQHVRARLVEAGEGENE